MTGVDYVVDLKLWLSPRRFRLPGESRSLLYEFEEGKTLIGAHAVTVDERDFAPGTSRTGVVLSPRADVDEVYAVAVGDRFKVWCGGDVGEGVVTDVRPRST